MHGGWKLSRWGIVLRVDTHEKLVDHFISEDHNTSTLFSYFVSLAIIVQNIACLPLSTNLAYKTPANSSPRTKSD